MTKKHCSKQQYKYLLYILQKHSAIAITTKHHSLWASKNARQQQTETTSVLLQ